MFLRSGDRFDAGITLLAFCLRADRMRGDTLLHASASRSVCASPAAIGRRHSRQCGKVSASSCVSGAAILQTPFGSSPKSRAINMRSSKRSSRNASTSGAYGLHGIKCERITIALVGMQDA